MMMRRPLILGVTLKIEPYGGLREVSITQAFRIDMKESWLHELAMPRRILECLEGEKLSYERVYVCDRSPCRQLFALASWDSGGRGPRMAYHYTSGGGGRGRLPC